MCMALFQHILTHLLRVNLNQDYNTYCTNIGGKIHKTI